MKMLSNRVRLMSETVENQSDVEVRLEELRAQIQFQERAREIVIRDAEILRDLAK
jgi:uncharacterized membrane-anchored protein YhcB (DUF1043 family)